MFIIAIVIVYAPTAQKMEEEIDNYYNFLNNDKALRKSQNLNAKLGKEGEDAVIDNFVLGCLNKRGEGWVQ